MRTRVFLTIALITSGLMSLPAEARSRRYTGIGRYTPPTSSSFRTSGSRSGLTTTTTRPRTTSPVQSYVDNVVSGPYQRPVDRDPNFSSWLRNATPGINSPRTPSRLDQATSRYGVGPIGLLEPTVSVTPARPGGLSGRRSTLSSTTRVSSAPRRVESAVKDYVDNLVSRPYQRPGDRDPGFASWLESSTQGIDTPRTPSRLDEATAPYGVGRVGILNPITVSMTPIFRSMPAEPDAPLAVAAALEAEAIASVDAVIAEVAGDAKEDAVESLASAPDAAPVVTATLGTSSPLYTNNSGVGEGRRRQWPFTNVEPWPRNPLNPGTCNDAGAVPVCTPTTTVPEPMGCVLLGGLASLLAARRRRR